MALLIDQSSTTDPSNDTVPINLKPTPGFCVKSATTDAGSYTYREAGSSAPTLAPSSTLLDFASSSDSKSFSVPKGVKVFLNIAWDANVPAPPAVNESAVRRAMAGDDLDVSEASGSYYVPVVVSEPREAVDKAGKQSLVFDCVFSATLKSWCTKDRDFRLYLIELALEHVEEKLGLTLSRQIGTPNIASKGKLEARTVLIPKRLLNAKSDEPLLREAPAASASDAGKAAPQTPKSILKNSPGASAEAQATPRPRPLIEEITNTQPVAPPASAPADEDAFYHEFDIDALPAPRWAWSESGGALRIEVDLPSLTHALHAKATLDVEAQRLVLHVPETYFLDINLGLPDAQIGKINSFRLDESDASAEEKKAEDREALKIKGHNAGQALKLKRKRDFDVEAARAEWRVQEKKLVVFV